MRRLLIAVIIAAFSTQPVLAERRCASLSDQSAFEVQALRSELMVLATDCSNDQQYNDFIHRFQPDLQANERAIHAYFLHRYGRAAQTEQDRFVTDMANALSGEGVQLGGDFCPRNGTMFHEVLSLDGATQLAEYAAGKNLIPASVDVCTPMPTTTMAARKEAAKKKN